MSWFCMSNDATAILADPMKWYWIREDDNMYLHSRVVFLMELATNQRPAEFTIGGERFRKTNYTHFAKEGDHSKSIALGRRRILGAALKEWTFVAFRDEFGDEIPGEPVRASDPNCGLLYQTDRQVLANVWTDLGGKKPWENRAPWD